MMFRLSCAVAFCVFVALCSMQPSMAHAQLSVRSAILMDLGSGKILYEQDADEPIPPASLTKVLTMYMAMERVQQGDIQLESSVRVSRAAARTRGSRMALTPQEVLPLEELLLGMAVSSGNDASTAVAEFLAGNQQDFVTAMNAKARQLGMTNSVFCNPHGLPAQGQMTTARDMLMLSRSYLNAFPQALRYHSTRYMRHNGVVTYNKNPLLGNYAGADGLKTGWVNASGYNLISTVQQGNTRLLAVIMGAADSKTRGRETHRLIEAGFKVARGDVLSVAEALPSMNAYNYTITADKTAREAYAVLAPETVKQVNSKKVVKKKRSTKKSKANTDHARRKTAPSTQAQKQRKYQDAPQASLQQPKG